MPHRKTPIVHLRVEKQPNYIKIRCSPYESDPGVTASTRDTAAVTCKRCLASMNAVGGGVHKI